MLSEFRYGTNVEGISFECEKKKQIQKKPENSLFRVRKTKASPWGGQKKGPIEEEKRRLAFLIFRVSGEFLFFSQGGGKKRRGRG